MRESGNDVSVPPQVQLETARPLNIALLMILMIVGNGFVYGFEVPEPQILVPGDGNPGDNFGHAVVIAGETLLVGAPSHAHDFVTGAVYVYEVGPTGWEFKGELAVGGYFDPQGVALSGPHLAVGRLFDNTVECFQRIDGVWQHSQTIENPAGPSGHFGHAVAIDGNTMAIGVPSRVVGGKSTGGVQFFEFDGQDWQFDEEWVPSDPLAWNGCGVGSPLSLVNHLLATGGCGGAVFFTQTNDQWSYWGSKRVSAEIGLGAPKLTPDHRFVASAPFDFPGFGTGAVTVWEPIANDWELSAVLHPQLTHYWEWFGVPFDILDDILIVGKYNDDVQAENAGCLYVFSERNDIWGAEAIIDPPTPRTDLNFGYSVSMTQDVWAVGARSDASETGEAYVYDFIPAGARIFADGFEYGDTSEWSEASP